MAKKTAATDSDSEPRAPTLALSILSPGSFRDRAAVRDFVAGPRFEALLTIVQGTLGVYSPSEEHERSSERARNAAYFLIEDLKDLAKAAASTDEAPLAVRDGMEHLLVQRAAFLSTLRAHSDAVGLVPEILCALDEAIQAIEKEEEALRSAASAA